MLLKSATGYKSVRIPRFCDRPTRRRYSVVFLGPRANAQSVPKIHVAFHSFLPISNAKLTSKFSARLRPNFLQHAAPQTPNSPQTLSLFTLRLPSITLPSSLPNALRIFGLPFPEGRAGPREIQSSKHFCFLGIHNECPAS